MGFLLGVEKSPRLQPDCNPFIRTSVQSGCLSPSVEGEEGRRFVLEESHDRVVAVLDRLLDVARRGAESSGAGSGEPGSA